MCPRHVKHFIVLDVDHNMQELYTHVDVHTHS